MKKLFFVFLTFFSVGIISCEKEKPTITSNGKSLNSNEDREARKFGEDQFMTSCYELSDDDISAIGDLHNNYLDAALKDFDTFAKDPRKELEDQFKDVNGIEGLSIDQIRNLTTAQNEKTVEEYVENNPRAAHYISQGEELINMAENYNQIQLGIEKLYNQAKIDLKCEYQNVVLIYLETLKESAYFWLPQDLGGSGTGSTFIAAYNQNQKLSEKWRDIIVADGLGASGAFIEFAFVAAAGGPAGVGALAAAVGFQAAWSSGIAALV